jgi:hypothetical protein
MISLHLPFRAELIPQVSFPVMRTNAVRQRSGTERFDENTKSSRGKVTSARINVRASRSYGKTAKPSSGELRSARLRRNLMAALVDGFHQGALISRNVK